MNDIIFKLKPMIFIMSPPHSGSTLLRNMLAKHPLLFSPPELYLLSFSTMQERKQAFHDRPWLLKGLVQTFMEIYQLEYDAAAEMTRELEERNVPTLFVYGMIQANIGNKILVDKSPMNAGDFTNLGITTNCFERPCLIHLYRHPLSSVNTFMIRPDQSDVYQKPMDEITQEDWVQVQRKGEGTWFGSHAAMIHFKKIHGEHYYPVQYEALVKNPEKVMAGLLKFLQLPFDDKVLDPYEGVDLEKMKKANQKDFPMGDPRFYTHDSVDASLAERWKEVKLPTQVKESTQLLGHALGYKFPKNYICPVDKMHQKNRKVKLQKFKENKINLRPLKDYSVKIGRQKINVPAFSAKEANTLLKNVLALNNTKETLPENLSNLLDVLQSFRKKSYLHVQRLKLRYKDEVLPTEIIPTPAEIKNIKHYLVESIAGTLVFQGLDAKGHIVLQKNLMQINEAERQALQEAPGSPWGLIARHI